MPKLFQIMVFVEQIAVGEVMTRLNNMKGVAKIDLQLGSQKPARLNGTSRGNKSISMRAPSIHLLHTALMKRKNRAISRAEIREVFIKDGRSADSVDSAILPMKKAGLLETIIPGTFQLTAAGKKPLPPIRDIPATKRIAKAR